MNRNRGCGEGEWAQRKESDYISESNVITTTWYTCTHITLGSNTGASLNVAETKQVENNQAEPLTD